MKVDTHRLSKGLFSGFCSPLLSCSLSLFRSGINHIPERRSAARLPPRIPLTQTSPEWIVWYTHTRPSTRSTSLLFIAKFSGGNFRRVGIAGNELAGTITENQSEKIPPRSAPLTVKTFQLYKNLKLTNVLLSGNFVTTTVSPQIDRRGSCVVTKWRRRNK